MAILEHEVKITWVSRQTLKPNPSFTPDLYGPHGPFEIKEHVMSPDFGPDKKPDVYWPTWVERADRENDCFGQIWPATRHPRQDSEEA